MRQIEELVPSAKGKVEVLPLDLASLDSVRKMASMFNSGPGAAGSEPRKLHVLVNNAGYGGGGPGGITEDKLEWYFQVGMPQQTLHCTFRHVSFRVAFSGVERGDGALAKMHGTCG